MSTTDHDAHVEGVRAFYAQNTEAFLRLGAHGGTAAIHIALWPEGTERIEQAMNVANDLVLSVVSEVSIPVQRILDLGCGVGASLHYLAQALPDEVQLQGLTVCPEQARWAREHNPDAARVDVQAGDFHDAASRMQVGQVAYAIEAFAHAASPGRFFEQAALLIETGGRLVIIDDVCATTDAPSKALRTYRDNWMVPSVQPHAVLDPLAEAVGFRRIHTQDLTPWLKLGRPRDRWLRWSLPLWGWTASWWNYAKSMKGGDARQRCLEQGETRFSMVVYERV